MLLMVLAGDVQGYQKANATQNTMYQVRWGADYLMKMIGHDNSGNLDIIYQVSTRIKQHPTVCQVMRIPSTDISVRLFDMCA